MCRASIRPAGRESANPCAASAIRRACAPVSRSAARRRGHDEPATHSSPTAASTAGRGRLSHPGRSSMPAFSADHEHHRHDDHQTAHDLARGQMLAGEQHAEHHCHHRVDVCVGGYQRGRGVRQGVDVRAERDDGSEDHQVAERQPGLRADIGEVQPGELTAPGRDHDQGGAARDHLDERHHRRFSGNRGSGDEQGTRRPAERRQQDEQRIGQVDVPTGPGQQQQGQAAQPDEHTGDGEQRSPVADETAQHDEPQRDDGHQQCGQTGRQSRLGEYDHAVTAGKHQHSADCGIANALGVDPPGGGPQPYASRDAEDDPGEEEPNRRRRERRHRLHRPANREVCRPPQHVNRPERDPDPGGRKLPHSTEPIGGHRHRARPFTVSGRCRAFPERGRPSRRLRVRMRECSSS